MALVILSIWICTIPSARKNMNSTIFPTEFSTSHNDTLPPSWLVIVSHFVAGPFIGTESLCPCLGFVFAEGRTVFLLQFLADADIPFQPIAVRNAFAIVVHAVEDEVAMGIESVTVPDDDILGILDSHPFHSPSKLRTDLKS